MSVKLRPSLMTENHLTRAISDKTCDMRTEFQRCFKHVRSTIHGTLEEQGVLHTSTAYSKSRS